MCNKKKKYVILNSDFLDMFIFDIFTIDRSHIFTTERSIRSHFHY